jgi:hypothetical protein
MAADAGWEAGGRRTPRPRHDGFSEERKQLFLVALRRGDSVLTACAIIGISNRTAYRHRERDPEFARNWDLARQMSRTPLELAAFQRGVTGIEEPVYRYGKLSHTTRRLSDAALMKLLAAEQPEKYGRAAGLGPLIDRLETRIDAQVTAEVAALGEALEGEIVHFVTTVFDRLLPVIASIAERCGSPAGDGRGPPAPEISPNPLKP